MEKNEFVYDLKTPETTWSGSSSTIKEGVKRSTAGLITNAEGPHGLYWCLDTVMYKNPEGTDFTKCQMPHYHLHGYETFFVDSGKLWLYINGQRALAQTGDIVQLQAGQNHGMGWLEDVKWRGTYHDFFTYPEFGDVARVKAAMPELADDPELNSYATRGFMDHIDTEPFLCEEVPTEQCQAIKNIERPHAAYDFFPGLSFRVVVERWENGGVKELDCAVMEPGFCVEWQRIPPLRELLYLRKGRIRFKVMGKEFEADDECVIDLPRYAPRSFEVLEHSELFDMSGQSYYSLFFQDYAAIRHYDPARLTPETVEGLKKKYDVQIARVGMKG